MAHAKIPGHAERAQRMLGALDGGEARRRSPGVPYGRRDERHGDDGCDHVGMPRARESSRISAFVKPSSASGERMPCSDRRLLSRAMIGEIVGIRAVDDRRDPALGAHALEHRPELRLAEVAAVRRIRDVARIVHLVRVDLEHGDPRARCDIARGLPLLRGIRRAAPDHREKALGAHGLDGDAGEIRGVDAAAEAEEERLVRSRATR